MAQEGLRKSLSSKEIKLKSLSSKEMCLAFSPFVHNLYINGRLRIRIREDLLSKA